MSDMHSRHAFVNVTSAHGTMYTLQCLGHECYLWTVGATRAKKKINKRKEKKKKKKGKRKKSEDEEDDIAATYEKTDGCFFAQAPLTVCFCLPLSSFRDHHRHHHLHYHHHHLLHRRHHHHLLLISPPPLSFAFGSDNSCDLWPGHRGIHLADEAARPPQGHRGVVLVGERIHFRKTTYIIIKIGIFTYRLWFKI